MSTRCASCGAAIEWARTPSGNRIPLDAVPPVGNLVVVDGVAYPADPLAPGPLTGVIKREGPLRGVHGQLRLSHFATCQYAAQHRRTQ